MPRVSVDPEQFKRGIEVRTKSGRWRFAVALYSDGSVGTVRAEGNSKAGRFTVLEAEQIAAVRNAR